MRKRKSVEDDQIFRSLEGQIKRVRITYTPGELRLSKDIEEVARFTDVSVTSTDSPSVATITFLNSEELLPSRFVVTVPRFYPHNPPTIQCVDIGLTPFSSFFDENGHLIHAITSDWRAIYSLATVVQSLREVRDLYKFGLKGAIGIGVVGVGFTDEEDNNSIMEEEP